MVETEFGKLTISKEKVLSIEYDEKGTLSKEQKKEIEKGDASEVLGQIELNRLQSRKQLDLIALLTGYGLTIVGDLAVGGDFFIGSAVPVIGPFINIGLVEKENYLDPADTDRDRLLFLLSGIVQTGFFVDYLASSGEERDLLYSKLGFRIQPMYKNPGLVFSFNF